MFKLLNFIGVIGMFLQIFHRPYSEDKGRYLLSSFSSTFAHLESKHLAIKNAVTQY